MSNDAAFEAWITQFETLKDMELQHVARVITVNDLFLMFRAKLIQDQIDREEAQADFQRNT